VGQKQKQVKKILFFFMIALLVGACADANEQTVTEIIQRKLRMSALMEQLCQKLDSVAKADEFVTEKDLKIYSVAHGQFAIEETNGTKEYNGTFMFDEYSVNKNSIVYYRLGNILFNISDGIFHSAPEINMQKAETLLKQLVNCFSKEGKIS